MEEQRVHRGRLLATAVLALAVVAQGGRAEAQDRAGDPHYTAAGFFDIHVCNWPDRAPFFMTLFSTTAYDAVQKIEVFSPDGRPLVTLNPGRYRVVRKKGKPEKHVFITQIPVPPGSTDGWYNARVTMKDGTLYQARDEVHLQLMAWAQNIDPPNKAELAVPSQLSWEPLAGAKYYKVYIRDLWEDGRQIFESKLLTEPRLVLPPGLLKTDGWYAWRIHARDINEDIALGDFNHGSLSPEAEFVTRPSR
jgi:hypothetical protein